MRPVDVDFTFAIHNRTGKFFIGRDIIHDNADQIGDIYFARLRRHEPPSSLGARIAARFSAIEIQRRAIGSFVPVPLMRSGNPVLHLDPISVLNWHVSAQDAVIVHDIGPITHPDLFGPLVDRIYDAAYRKIVAAGTRCIFVSQSSHDEFCRLFPNDVPRHVIYPPIRTDLAGIGTRPAGAPDRFILTVGAIGARKNQLGAIRAYASSGLHEHGVGYVLCGGSEQPGHAEALKAAQQTPGVLMLSYVENAELVWLYNHALGFVLASRLEGFGMPIAEAMAVGVVPAVSKATVLEEVAGPGGLFFDPEDDADIAAAMVRLVHMPEEERNARRALLKTQLACFSDAGFRTAWREVLSGMRHSI